MKKTMTIISMLLGIGAIGMFVLASVVNFSLGWTIGLVMLIAAILVALVIAFFAFIDGDEGNNIGSYRAPRT
jgi:ABC-type multidrug transport system fused ATPase/permease subunit